jgi:arsenate reductase-like glutaredoxin family protein
MDMVEDELRKLFDEIGLESIRTTHGTVYRSVKTQYQVNDWDNMYKFVMEHNVPQLLQRRISPINMKQFLSENPNLMPIGMNIDNKYTVTVRRSK